MSSNGPDVAPERLCAQAQRTDPAEVVDAPRLYASWLIRGNQMPCTFHASLPRGSSWLPMSALSPALRRPHPLPSSLCATSHGPPHNRARPRARSLPHPPRRQHLPSRSRALLPLGRRPLCLSAAAPPARSSAAAKTATLRPSSAAGPAIAATAIPERSRTPCALLPINACATSRQTAPKGSIVAGSSLPATIAWHSRSSSAPRRSAAAQQRSRTRYAWLGHRARTVLAWSRQGSARARVLSRLRRSCVERASASPAKRAAGTLQSARARV